MVYSWMLYFSKNELRRNEIVMFIFLFINALCFYCFIILLFFNILLFTCFDILTLYFFPFSCYLFWFFFFVCLFVFCNWLFIHTTNMLFAISWLVLLRILRRCDIMIKVIKEFLCFVFRKTECLCFQTLNVLSYLHSLPLQVVSLPHGHNNVNKIVNKTRAFSCLS